MKIFVVVLFAVFSSAFADDRFVIITDSHGMGKYGESLKALIRKRQDTSYHFFASGGSAPLQWLNRAFTTPCGFEETSDVPMTIPVCKKLLTPKLSDLWDKYPMVDNERKISVIVQGTNFSLSSSHYAEQVRFTKQLTKVAVEKSDVCIWVGPPNMKRAPDFNTEGVAAKIKILMAALHDQCHFIDSREISTYPESGDGIHYHWPGSRNQHQIDASLYWAELTFTRIEKILTHL